MRNILWKITVQILVLLILASSAFTQGLTGWMDITKGNQETLQNGAVISESDSLNRIFYLSFREPVTKMISYQFNLRSNWQDSDSTNEDGQVNTSYKRTVEPSMDLFLINPMYDVSTGYRQQEQWSTANLKNDGRLTTQFYYTRMGLTPQSLPSLNLQLDRQRKFDYLSVSTTDSTNTIYTVNSAYALPSSDVSLRYTVNYTISENETPLQSTTKSDQNNFNGTFNSGYTGGFWNNRAVYSIVYQGNYTRNKSEQTVPETGIVLNKRLSLGGLHVAGSGDGVNDDGVLTNNSGLVDGNQSVSSGINLNAAFHNIGIFVSSSSDVDRLYVYVNKDVDPDSNLDGVNDWVVAWSNFNQDLSWTNIPIKDVNISVVDSSNDIYRYEIEFVTPQSASFFKVINRNASSVSNVEVTEIEAYGEDNVSGTLLNVFSNYNQQLNFSITIDPWDKWKFLFNYSVDRADENPESPMNSMGGLLGNIFSNKIKEDHLGFKSNASRNYSIASTWLTHSLLTTTFRIQRNESFDDTDETDSTSNTYNLAFVSAPIPAVDASFTLIRNDSFSFNDKTSTNNTAVLSVGTELYRNVNMITDIGYTNSHSFVNDTKSSSRRLNGTIDALLTRKLSTTANYDFSWNESDGSTSNSSNSTATITYRPGKFVNITGTFSFSDSNDESTTTEGILVDWLPVPAIRMNVNYQHSATDPGPSTSDTVNSIITWYITRFADVRTTYGYTKTVAAQETESINMRTSLNCRF